MSDQALLADFQVALDHTMAVFTAMTDKVMSGRVTWDNIQAELTDDEQAIFWALMQWGRRDAAERIGEGVAGDDCG